LSGPRIGIIGGSGLYSIQGVSVKEEVSLETPFGYPSDSFMLCEIAGREVVFLPRHGRGHTLLPTELPFRANIYGMKMLGVEWIVSVSAVGSMKEHLHPRDVVLPRQFIDRTSKREDTFFGEGIVAHVAFADPICAALSAVVAGAARNCGATVHEGGTYLCMEGPAFSTRAESFLYRSWGVDVIGMTNLQEAKLAREAEICYATLAMVTDYDCWHETAASVTAEMVLENLRRNAALAQGTILAAASAIPRERRCACARALENAIVTDASKIRPETRKKLELIIGKYVK
jgi:5'-methylthioadenosine phosphorylase